MSTDALKKFAEGLKTQREAKGLSLQQIHSKTKIDIKFLSAIENANFEILPEIYIRAFIKEYAGSVDLDPKEIIKNFDSAKMGKPDAKTDNSEIKTEKKPDEQIQKAEIKAETLPEEKIKIQESPKEVISQKPEETAEVKSFSIDESHPEPLTENNKPKFPGNLNYVIGAVILLAALVLIYFSFIHESAPEIIPSEPLSSTVESPSKFELIEDKKENVPETPIVSDDSLSLQIEVLKNVWVKVVCDGNEKLRKVILEDQKLEFKSEKEFNISIGNAGAVKILYNGKPLENVGKEGEIRNIRIRPDDIRYLTIPRTKANE